MTEHGTKIPRSRQSSDRTAQLNYFRRLKQFSHEVSFPGVFGFFFLSLILIFCIFFLDYTTVISGLRFHGKTLAITGIGFGGTVAEAEAGPEASTGEEADDAGSGTAGRTGTETEDGGRAEAEDEETGAEAVYAETGTEAGAKTGAEGDDAETGAGAGAGAGAKAGTEDADAKVGFLEEGGGGCNIFEGNWTRDESYPLYQSENCPFSDEGFRCTENGRPDRNYTKWRWQPKDCNLPRFDPKLMLEKLRNRRVAFIGDSIGRNQ